jgi:hypothetical protein
MSILAVNEELKEVYIADDNQLKVFNISYDQAVDLKNTFLLPPSRLINSRINNLMLSKLSEKCILVALTQSAMIFVFFPLDWDRAPLKLDNYAEGYDDNSLWSCSMHGSHLAVGSNTALITVWDLETYEKKRLEAHSHNIPCVDYNAKGCLASTSIDTGVIVTTPSGSLLYCKPCSEWGWGVKWIPRAAFSMVSGLPRTNISNLSGRYKSNLPTLYFNQFTGLRGVFDIQNANNYLNTFTRRLEGVPSDSDDESDMIVSFPLDIQEDFSEYLLIQTSKNSIHLIDPGLYKFNDNNHMHVLSVFIPSLEIQPGGFSRLSLLNFVPEFSLTVVGNQFGREVLFLRLCKCKNPSSTLGWDYSFYMETSIVLDAKIIGLYLGEVFDGNCKMYALTENLSFYVFKITKTSVEKLLIVRV